MPYDFSLFIPTSRPLQVWVVGSDGKKLATQPGDFATTQFVPTSVPTTLTYEATLVPATNYYILTASGANDLENIVIGTTIFLGGHQKYRSVYLLGT